MAKGSSSSAKSKKLASAPAHPKYEDMIRDAIVALKERKGSSRQAIKKYILTTYKLPDNNITNNRLRLAINKGVEKGVFSFPNAPVRKAAVTASTRKAAAKPKKAATTTSKRTKASTTKKAAEKKTGTRRRAAASS
ncbi:7222_t:CDS:2 [Funneliformis geosporum]|nr:7222_t:CDS:2 [Funneliformis geosporum]